MKEDLKFFVGSDKDSPLYISLAGVTYPHASYAIKRAKSDVWVIEYVTGGEGYVLADGQIHHICQDMIYFLSKDEEHFYYADSNNPYQKIFINVSGQFCKSVVSSYGLLGKHFFDGVNLKHVFEKIPKVIHSDLSENQMQSALQGIFVEIIANLSRSETESKYDSEALIIKNYLDLNLDRAISVKELSHMIYRSQDYCQKLFIKKFGITPYAYHINAKMQKAKTLLTSTNLSVGEIARSLGYNDAHYFSNLFNAKCGCRPLKYRKDNG